MSGRVLVAYASKYGGTAEIAQAIAEAMRAEGLDAEAREAATVTDLTGYDAAVVGSGVYMGRCAAEARKFVKQHRAELRATLERLLAPRSAVDWAGELSAVGVPAGPINSVADALAEPQVIARGLRIAPEGIPGLRTPIRFSRSELVLDRAAPMLPGKP